MLTAWVTAAALALAVGAAAFTIARTKVTEPFRNALVSRGKRADKVIQPWHWFGGLVSCPYCTSHWLAAVAVLIYRPILVSSGVWTWVDLGVSWLAVTAGAAYVVGKINASIKP